ncbi:hypothetical protein [Serratia fonticola]|uniref:hypothetical protein n=1 Tax=Serratia fonticola TaxID=47917 RepID=UPI0027E9DBD9|nr:hypothetical protein [Serratia fonticola]MDQ7209411.1 hypothetical protein [Serratia fonticola]HBE9078591.1 hypothetical protein [Serratia fonticola]HBE9089895.1 hypothetical protein [Serratia fonticola]
MAQSIADIQRRSDEKRGVRSKGFKLPIATIELIESLAAQTGKPQSAVITEAVKMLEASLK